MSEPSADAPLLPEEGKSEARGGGSEAEIRAAIVEEARSWLKTPWHHMGHVKGHGVDCAYFLIEVFHACGLVPEIDLGYYSHDWHLHTGRPRFLEELVKYADRLPAGKIGQPGDVAMFKFGRQAAHGTIVIEWPLIIHAYRDERMVTLSDAKASTTLAERFAGFWRLKCLAPHSALRTQHSEAG